MTTTDAPTTTGAPPTTGGGVPSVTGPSVPPAGPQEGSPADPGGWWSRSPWIIAGAWVDRYFGCLSVTLQLTRQVALSWTEPVRWPSGATREQPDTGGAAMPEQRPVVTGGAAAGRGTDPGRQTAGDQIAQTRRTRTRRAAQQPDRDVHTTAQVDPLPAQKGSGTGFVDGLIGHLMDRDITGSLGIDR